MTADPFRILLICMGNCCRSPIAEALLRKRLAEKGLDEDVLVESAGISAVDGVYPSSQAVYEVLQRGASLDGFRSRSLTREMGGKSHLCIVMTQQQQFFMDEMYPECSDKVRILGQYLLPEGPLDIPDPMGGDDAAFDRVSGYIENGVERIVEDWEEIRNRFYETRKFVVAFGADHRGFAVKNFLIERWEKELAAVIDCGTDSEASCDHPDYAFLAAGLVARGKADRGVLICSTGHGMLLAANKVHGIRCVMPYDEEHARMSRTHNNANMLAMGADYFERDRIDSIVRAWMEAGFLGGKYQRRISKIMACESRDFAPCAVSYPGTMQVKSYYKSFANSNLSR